MTQSRLVPVQVEQGSHEGGLRLRLALQTPQNMYESMVSIGFVHVIKEISRNLHS